MAKLIATVSTTCLIALLFYWHFQTRSSTHAVLDAGAIVKEARQLNELATVRYSIEKVVGLKEEKSPLGAESILLLVRANVLAGVDLSELKPENVVVGSDGAVSIRLTPAHIQQAYLDEKYTKVWDRSVTWWTPWVSPNNDLEHKARLQALEDIRKSAVEMGILEQARRNAESDLTHILGAFGIQRVTFSYGS